MDSADKLRQLLNDQQLPPKEFTERNLTIHVPSSDDGGTEWNTKVQLQGNPGKGYYGTDEVFYKRIALDQIDHNTPIRSDKTLTPELVVELANKTLGLWLTVDDIEAFEPPVIGDGETGTVTLTAVPGSIGFIGSIELTVEFGRAWLDIMVSSRNLRVLKHPIAVDYRRSARMLTWSKDFTSLRDKLLLVRNQYSDFDGLVAACAEMQIPAWQQASATDYSTSDIADANPLFDRVVIQRGAVSGMMVGDLYFHYNVLEEI